MKRVMGWYSTASQVFVLTTDDEPVVEVSPEQFLEASEQVANDEVAGKCTVRPFLCPYCSGWTASYPTGDSL